MGSPYPWHYDLRWGWYHLRPSMRAHVTLARRPLEHSWASAPAIVRVVMFGDLMGLAGDRVPTASRALANRFARADLVIGNCEAPVIRDHNDPRSFHLARLSLGAQYLRDFFARFHVDPARTVLTIANNHAGDHGPSGLIETEARLAALNVRVAGAHGPLTVARAGELRVGVLSWTDWMNCDRPAARVPRTDDVDFVDWYGRRKALALDTMLASPHWEWEFQHLPRPETVAMAGRLASFGIDAIAGHHPHVIQPIAWLDGAGRAVPCMFSLGNLFARTLTWPHRLGALLELDLAADGPARGNVIAYRAVPIVQLGEAADARCVLLDEAPPELRARCAARIAALFEAPALTTAAAA